MAVTYGLEQAFGLVESEARLHRIEHAIRASVGLSDGERLWAVRYATDSAPPSLFVSADAAALYRLHPDNPRLQQLRDDDRLVVSEPFNDLPGAWNADDPWVAVVVPPNGWGGPPTLSSAAPGPQTQPALSARKHSAPQMVPPATTVASASRPVPGST